MKNSVRLILLISIVYSKKNFFVNCYSVGYNSLILISTNIVLVLAVYYN